MNYKSFNLGDWIGHISGVIEDETTLDGNEMRDLVEFLTTLKQKPVLDKIRAEIKALTSNRGFLSCSVDYIHEEIDAVFDKYKAESEE